MLRVLSSNEPGTQKGLQSDEHYYYLLMGDFWATVIKTRRKRERERERESFNERFQVIRRKQVRVRECVCTHVCEFA